MVHKTIDYPGVPVDHSTVQENAGILKNVRVPDPAAFRRARPGARRGGHGRLDPAELHRRQHRRLAHRQGRHACTTRWRSRARCSRPATPHASQGDSELCGTAIECSLTGTFQLILHKKDSLAGTALAGLDYPLLETQDEWVLHGFSFPNYLAELGPDAQSKIYEKSSVDLAHARRVPQDAALPHDHQGL